MGVKKPGHIITIGASAGGLNAITELVSTLPDSLNAAVFVVLHLSKLGFGNFMIDRLQKYTSYTCKVPQDGDPVEADHIYLAPADEHLLVTGETIALGRGPAENRWRPSIDVLFRSAAAHYSDRVIGIILTGYLNDGTSGMLAIKKSGGQCIVQDPNEAEYPDMPVSVLENMEVDHCLPLREIGRAIKEIISSREERGIPAPADVVWESSIAERAVISLDELIEKADKSLYSCPDCGGGLWSIKEDKMERFRCHIGHSYSEKDLLSKQSESIEATLWVALRMMEERRLLLKKMAGEQTGRGYTKLGQIQQDRANELEVHIQRLKELLFMTKHD